MESLLNKRSELRALRPEDATWMLAVENNPTWWSYGDNQSPYSREDIEAFIEESMATAVLEQTQLRRVITVDGLPVGMVDLFEIDHDHLRAGIGILLFDSAYRSKGLASQSIGSMEMYAKNTLGLHQLHCSVRAENRPARKLFEGLGYLACGERKDWYRKGPEEFEDERLYQKIL